jgi:hypothetical protein
MGSLKDFFVWSKHSLFDITHINKFLFHSIINSDIVKIVIYSMACFFFSAAIQ